MNGSFLYTPKPSNESTSVAEDLITILLSYCNSGSGWGKNWTSSSSIWGLTWGEEEGWLLFFLINLEFEKFKLELLLLIPFVLFVLPFSSVENSLKSERKIWLLLWCHICQKKQIWKIYIFVETCIEKVLWVWFEYV